MSALCSSLRSESANNRLLLCGYTLAVDIDRGRISNGRLNFHCNNDLRVVSLRTGDLEVP